MTRRTTPIWPGDRRFAFVATLFAAVAFVLYFSVMAGAEAGESPGRLEKKRYIQAAVLPGALALALRSSTTASLAAALMLAGLATAPVFPKGQMLAAWRELSFPWAALMWIPQVTHLFLLPLVLAFYSMLPRPLIPLRWFWLAAVPFVPAAAWTARNLHAAIYDPGKSQGTPSWIYFATGVAVLVYGFGGLLALAINYRNEKDPILKGRMRLFVYGTIAGWSPGLLFLAAIFLAQFTTSQLVWELVSTRYRLFSLGMFVIALASLAYGAIKHRLLEVQTR